MEALDLALRLGMAGRPVPLADAEPGEQVLEGVVAAGEARGVDRAIVGERGRGPAVRLAGRAEGGHHVIAVDPPKGRGSEQVAGVIVEPRADLDLAAVGEAPVGHVRLPDLVGRVGLEAVPGTAGALAWLGRDEARGHEDASDGRGRGGVEPFPLEVPGERHRPGIEALRGELGAPGDDPLPHLLRCPAGVAAWPPRARLDRLEAALTVAAEQALEMLSTEPELGCGGGDGRLLRDDLEDGHPVLRHATDCRLCPDSPVAYHLSPMS